MAQKRHSLADLMLALRRRINEGVKEHPLKRELTMTQLEALWFIALSGKRSMDEIAAHLSIKPPSVTSLVDTMEKKGFVKRTKDPRDRRVSHVVLTSSIRRELTSLRQQTERALTTIVSKLSTKERKEFERLLSRLITS